MNTSFSNYDFAAQKENLHPYTRPSEYLETRKGQSSLNNSFSNVNRSFGRELVNVPRNVQRYHPYKPEIPTQSFEPRRASSKRDFVASSSILDPKRLIRPPSRERPVLAQRNSYSAVEYNIELNRSRLESKKEILKHAAPETTGLSPKKTQYEQRRKGSHANILEDERNDFGNRERLKYVVDYAKQIFTHMKNTEEKYLAQPNYITLNQKDINPKMRAILIDWLIDVHNKFKMRPETLFLTVNLIDRYLELVTITRQKLQLVGVASLLIAAKYEEIYPPRVKDLVYVTDSAFKREEILDMEGKILAALKFRLTAPSSYEFYQRFVQLAQIGENAAFIGCYLLELALVDYKMMKYTARMLACGAVYAAKASEGKTEWSDVLARNSEYDETAVKACAEELAQLMVPSQDKIVLTAAKRKYSQSKYGGVANTVLKKF